MIPKQMETYLRERLPEQTFEKRLIRDGGRCYLELSSLDVDRLARLGIVCDNLGPRLVSCMWDEESPLEIGGYLVVDNLAMGRPSMGGIRMLPDVTPAAIHNLARGMTLKNAAARLPYGGGKSGIVARSDLTPAEHTAVVRGFARLIHRYSAIYLPGPDVGTNDADMKTIAIENGLNDALSKPAVMGGNRIDQLGAAAGGAIIALDELLQQIPRLGALPQFGKLQIPTPENLAVMIQGFGAVGAHAARTLQRLYPGCRVVGVSDRIGYLYDPDGLPVDRLFELWREQGLVTLPYYEEKRASGAMPPRLKYSTAANDLLRESAFCFIPAAPIAHYLDTDPATHPSMTVDRMGQWSLIVEGANTYSPDPARKAIRTRMEREVYHRRGVLIATDYLVNSGGVIFAAHEHLIKTPGHLRIPGEMLGNAEAVERWLADHAKEFEALAAQRLAAAELYRNEVIRSNMRELVDLLAADPDRLPCEAAESISVRRIAAREKSRTVANIMEDIPTVAASDTIQQGAKVLVESSKSILAVVTADEQLVGVVTDWDIARAVVQGIPGSAPLGQIMTKEVISACSDEPLLDVLRKLEYHEISALPVVDGQAVVGMISGELLARRSLAHLLQSQIETT